MVMKVKKRNGTIQDFNIDKIRLTLGRVSDEQSMPFTGSDLNLLTETIEKKIMETNKEIIRTGEIHEIVVNNLRDLGFKRIANAYSKYEKSFYRK